jgi:hypothetical protein
VHNGPSWDPIDPKNVQEWMDISYMAAALWMHDKTRRVDLSSTTFAGDLKDCRFLKKVDGDANVLGDLCFPQPWPKKWDPGMKLFEPMTSRADVKEQMEALQAEAAANAAKFAYAAANDADSILDLALDGGKRHYIPEHGIKTIAVGDIVAVWWNDTGEMRPGFATNGWVDCKVCGACF